jgi:hypothetical protein
VHLPANRAIVSYMVQWKSLQCPADSVAHSMVPDRPHHAPHLAFLGMPHYAPALFLLQILNVNDVCFDTPRFLNERNACTAHVASSFVRAAEYVHATFEVSCHS